MDEDRELYDNRNLNEIHKERIALEICQTLQQWLLDNRKEWIGRAMRESEVTVRAVRDIATKTSSPKGALEVIVALCTDD